MFGLDEFPLNTKKVDSWRIKQNYNAISKYPYTCYILYFSWTIFTPATVRSEQVAVYVKRFTL